MDGTLNRYVRDNGDSAALLQPAPPATIVIDEFKLGLHPYAITLPGTLIRAATNRH